MVGSKGKGSGEGGQKRRALPMLLEHGVWAHSVVLRARACASRKWCGDGAYSKYAEGVRRAAVVGLTCGP